MTVPKNSRREWKERTQTMKATKKDKTRCESRWTRPNWTIYTSQIYNCSKLQKGKSTRRKLYQKCRDEPWAFVAWDTSSLSNKNRSQDAIPFVQSLIDADREELDEKRLAVYDWSLKRTYCNDHERLKVLSSWNCSSPFVKSNLSAPAFFFPFCVSTQMWTQGARSSDFTRSLLENSIPFQFTLETHTLSLYHGASEILITRSYPGRSWAFDPLQYL